MKKRSPTKPKQAPVPAAAPSVPSRPLWFRWGPLLAIAVVVLIGYYQVAWHNFVAWDDHLYVMCHEPGEVPNARVASGLTLDNVTWAFTTDFFSNWHPIVWLSYMLDVHFFGLSAPAMLIENVLLHLANSLLLYGLLVHLTGARGRSLFVALLFAVHPTHVESVAWVSERKDVLSTLFWLLTTWAYVRYTERPTIERYLLILGAFALGLMTKPMLVTLPCTLWLLDFWPLRRFATLARSASEGEPRDRTAPRSRFGLVLEKLPMFALVAVSIGLTIWAQYKGGAIKSLDEMPLLVRLSNVTTAYFMYIKLMFWPMNLACLYPYPITPASSDGARTVFLVWGLIAAIGLAAISTACVMLRRRWPYLAFGWFWYLGTLVPVIGLLQVGLSGMADRYTYVPFIGLFVAITWWVCDLLPIRREGRPYLAAVATLIVIACLALTWRQVGYWHDTDTLLGHALAVTEDNFYLDRQWAVVLRKRGRIADAAVYYRRASKTRPDLATQHAEYGSVLIDLRRINKARQEQGLEYDPAWLRATVLNEAQQEFERALQTAPGESSVLSNLGVVYDEQGRREDAIRVLRESIKANPNHADSHYNLAQLLIRDTRYHESVPHFQAAIAAVPGLLDRRRQFISVLSHLDYHRQATPQERALLISELQALLALDPNDQEARQKLQEMQGS